MAKGPHAFRSISEASEELGLPQHVLRFWETKFSFIRPMKRAGGRRFYRPQDLVVLNGVRTLLHQNGYTIKDVQRLLREEGLQRLVHAGQALATDPSAPGKAGSGPALAADAEQRLLAALAGLEAAKARLAHALGAS